MTGAAAKENNDKLKRKDYEKELRKLQVELCHLQAWVKDRGLRVIILFEGRDAAGKGGTIKALTERVSPRTFRLVALPAPSDREKTEIYFQRYIKHFPAAGEIVIFDRSWYNRAGVEYVMGFCSKQQHQRFLELCPQLEKYIVDGGIMLIKIWLEVGQDEQEKRFAARVDRSVAAMEAEPDGCRIVRSMVRLFARPRHDARGNRQQTCAVVHRALRRQAAGAPQLHFAHSVADSAQEITSQGEGQASQALEQTKI